MSKIKNLFTEDVQKILTDESIEAIENAVNEKVEAALEEQDEEYATQLKTLVTTIDKDHTKKLNRILEAVDKDRAGKVVKIVKKYERDLKLEATNFRKGLVKTISTYLDEFLSENFSKADIEVAVKNKTAYKVLENLRHVLAVDSVLMNESIQLAVLDGKSKLDEQVSKNTESETKLKGLTEEN